MITPERTWMSDRPLTDSERIDRIKIRICENEHCGRRPREFMTKCESCIEIERAASGEVFEN